MARARGNLLIGQSGGATAVINASLVGAVRAALADDAVDGIYGAVRGIEGLLRGDVVDQRHDLADAVRRRGQALHFAGGLLGGGNRVA